MGRRACPQLAKSRFRPVQNCDFCLVFLVSFFRFFRFGAAKKKLRAFLGIAQVVEVTRGKISSGFCGYREKWGKKVQQEWKLWIVCVISDLANCRWLSQDFNKEAFSGLFFLTFRRFDRGLLSFLKGLYLYFIKLKKPFVIS